MAEFKSNARKNLHTGSQDLEWAVLKTLAGFMNANGGTLLIGVADDGSIIGIMRTTDWSRARTPTAGSSG